MATAKSIAWILNVLTLPPAMRCPPRVARAGEQLVLAEVSLEVAGEVVAVPARAEATEQRGAVRAEARRQAAEMDPEVEVV